MARPLSATSLIIALILFSFSAAASVTKIQGLHVATFGDPQKPAIIFVHGGPGFNSHDFEVTTADDLAARGYFVVVYDQRGQGQSDDAVNESDYTYKTYSDDIAMLIKTYNLKNPNLIGHSHGGPISLKFDQSYPGVVNKIILAEAPINFWSSMENILENCSRFYETHGNETKLQELKDAFSKIAPEASASISFEDKAKSVGAVFNDALYDCRLYNTKNPTQQALNKRALVKPVVVSDNNKNYPMPAFLWNEDYIHLDNTAWVTVNKQHIYGIYGDEDGLFTHENLALIKSALGGDSDPLKFQMIPGASHPVYEDQEDMFLDAVDKILK